MAFPGPAFLALWNDVTPQQAQEYNRWHTREHVPERVGIDGFLEGRRYRHAAAGQREYFTAYGVTSADVFQSPAYLSVIDHPTPWSASMRPALTRVLRAPCVTLGSAGSGAGGALACLRVHGHDAAAPGVASLLEACLALDGIVAAHLGRVFEARPEAFAHWSVNDAPSHVLLVEAEDMATVTVLRDTLVTLAARHLPGSRAPEIDAYALVFAIDHASVDASLKRTS